MAMRIRGTVYYTPEEADALQKHPGMVYYTRDPDTGKRSKHIVRSVKGHGKARNSSRGKSSIFKKIDAMATKLLIVMFILFILLPMALYALGWITPGAASSWSLDTIPGTLESAWMTATHTGKTVTVDNGGKMEVHYHRDGEDVTPVLAKIFPEIFNFKQYWDCSG